MVQRRVVKAALAAAVLLVTTGCSSDEGDKTDAAGSSPPSSSSAESPPPEQAADAAPPAKGSVTVVRTVAEDLDTPWGLAPLPEGGLLVSSRDEATISRIDEETGEETVLGEVPGVAPAGEGGLMGIAVSPEYASDHMIYAYFTSESDNRIVRMLYDPEKPAGEQLGAPDTILRSIPKGTNHNGGRLAFGPDKMLYASTGERYEGPLAQDKDSLGGKILRMTPDGEPAPGNPFDNSVVYSYGHRNVQGLAWDGKQRLWASEFGQNTWDELNQIKPGGNYGWPEVEGRGGKSGYIDPVAVWKTDEASPSGIAMAEGSVWMAGLRGQRLWRIPLDGTKTSADPQAFLEGDYGRLRTVVSAGGDKLWLVTSETDGRGSPEGGDDKILELEVK
ncbi:PQQ-dependent sugar dehydrogenase [Streptomyces europaeiscabiei]|uniref:PQQ-dependent sugar dehydrogenase n=1 Tax=Streptomyces europaeiscabiei TaxID=146819 RepID=UPI0029A0CDE4|nr:PQQ-dependent sugar dehydrogenase [Streptomyces europaeiscabiei]MDX3634878.1 PQQ-dependent sugar dehydrogenase [Streptomyces europaeiscabiei]MDX3651560.1 PQQ-dependent sugar dehydrogenase [Streptomyces europaeiscabiei]WUD35636.1 PQQ-dependent sugar dehydrogenase [Streptomyces europaeiscabiei]